MKDDHEYLGIHDYARQEEPEGEETLKSITPVKLVHFCMKLALEDKLNTLFSFLKSHTRSKIIVFFSARK